MEDLLPYYERELGIFRAYTREFAARFPKTAGHLLIAGETCEDPHIERLIQSFALLTARVAKRLDDDYPQLTEALLETLYPHYLRPFPSCSIARVDHSAGHDRDGILRVPRGTIMHSLPVRGVKCRFASAYDVVVAPIALTAARFDAIIDAPATVRLADGAGAAIHFVIECTSPLLDLHKPPMPALRLFVDGEPSFRAALFDALFLRQAGAWVEWTDGAGQESGRWHQLARLPLQAAGYAEQEALIPYSQRSHPAFRLLTEYFSFPEKFHFIDIDLAALAAVLPPGCRRCTLHLPLRALRSDSNAARLLSPLSAKHLLDGCTPVVNLFAKSGVPVRLTQTGSDYPVLADATHAFGYEVHTITSARLVRHGGDAGTAFYPLYAARHDDGAPDVGVAAAAAPGAGHGAGPSAHRPGRRHYWLARRDENVAAISPGHEMRITLVDGKAAGEAEKDAPAAGAYANIYAGATLALELLCTNRDLPASLRYGLPNGDLLSDVVPDGLVIRFLRKPSAPQRFASGAGAHWRLITHLSLNYSGLTDAGVEEFRKMLCLYDLAQSAISQRQINGIVGLEHGMTRAWMPGVPFATLMPGVRIRLRIDEQAFVGSGLFVFAQVMERYFGLNSQLNCFTQLDIVSHKTGEELIRCPARTAQATLT
jgi:type VI secretion system protein ImpG